MIYKFKVNGLLIPVDITAVSGNRLEVKFKYNKTVLEEIKAWEGPKWLGFEDPPRKIWTVADSQHNWFQIQYLTGKNPHGWWQRPYENFVPKRNVLRDYQLEGCKFAVTYRHGILAFEPGLGKTLTAIESMEWLVNQGMFKPDEILWIGPKSGLVAARYEFYIWKSFLQPIFLTYEGLKKYISQPRPTPRALILDESVKIKTPTSQRSQAARFVADSMRKEYGMESLILEMSGAPSPDNPSDWFFQAATAAPGFLREGTLKAFRDRLAWVVTTENSVTGGMYPTLIGWKDNEKKCAECGKEKDSAEHDEIAALAGTFGFHTFKPSKNEVKYLYQRMKGLVLVKLKKDCLKELPDKIFRRIECEPSKSVLAAAQHILKTAKNAVTGLMQLRELSDGFLYQNKVVGKEMCPTCFGTKKITIPDEQLCPLCNGTGEINKEERVTNEISSPKEGVVTDLLDEYEDVGRVLLWGGFTGSIEKLIKVVKKSGWNYIRVDGTGWSSDLMESRSPDNLYRIFQEKKSLYPKVAFISQPDSGGMALTLTASPVGIYYSNSFKGDSRIQSMERGHRPGMDINKGFTIIDILHLPSDKKVLDSLNRKIDLQALTMGDFSRILEDDTDPKIVHDR